ncbi:subtilisin family serine protease [Peribacillus sp. B2I2]|uniref:S8 family peptidase n=1 Tax=Peribacillus sp. B2I2 TaxID=3156468 RepID=UPI0035122498
MKLKVCIFILFFIIILTTCYYFAFYTKNSLIEVETSINKQKLNYINEKDWMEKYLATNQNQFSGSGVKVAVLDTEEGNSKCDFYYNEQKVKKNSNLHSDEIISTIQKISPDVTLYCATVASPSGEVHAHDLLMGIKWAIEQDVDIINMSLGFTQNIKEAESILKLANINGIVMIAASGNSGKNLLEYPASSPYVIAVGALDSNGNRWTYSNYGDNLDFVLPGVFFSSEKDYKQGTSYSTAIMSGIVGRILEEYPEFTPSNVYNKLIEMTDNQYKFNKFKGYGTPTFNAS